MTKSELVAAMKEKAGLASKAEAERSLDALTEVVTEALGNGGKLTLTGFGSFAVVERKARTGRNPRTGEPISIPAAKAVKFSPGKQLKDAVA